MGGLESTGNEENHPNLKLTIPKQNFGKGGVYKNGGNIYSCCKPRVSHSRFYLFAGKNRR